MKRIVASIGAALLLTGLALPALGNGQEKITICHFTSSETNPSVEITIALPAFEAHVENHEDGEFDTIGPCPVATTTTAAQTTTTVAETTTTTVAETTTTTQPEVTTTTQGPGPGPTTTTTLPFDSVGPTTTVPLEVPTTTVAETPVELEELPFTGFDPAVLAGVATLLSVSGAGLVRKGRTLTT